jgi:hypothetical protein
MITIDKLGAVGAHEPERMARVLGDRPGGAMPRRVDDKVMIIAADHPARGASAAGADPMAMSNRSDLLGWCVEALSRPGVRRFLGNPDIVEELALLGGLDGALVYGSTNCGGLDGGQLRDGRSFHQLRPTWGGRRRPGRRQDAHAHRS